MIDFDPQRLHFSYDSYILREGREQPSCLQLNASQGCFNLSRLNSRVTMGYARNKWDSRKGKIHMIEKDFGGCIIRRIKETDPKHCPCQRWSTRWSNPSTTNPGYIKQKSSKSSQVYTKNRSWQSSFAPVEELRDTLDSKYFHLVYLHCSSTDISGVCDTNTPQISSQNRTAFTSWEVCPRISSVSPKLAAEPQRPH